MSERVERLFWALGSLLVVFYAAVPIVWLVSLSLKSPRELASRTFFPRSVTLESYAAIFSEPQFRAALINSVGISLFATALAVTLGVFTAYAVTRLRFPGRAGILVGALAIAMFPPISIVGPLFDLWRRLGLFDTWPGLVLPYTTFTLPLAIWTLSAHFREIPRELEAAARIDGATRLQALRWVVVPLATPGIVATTVLVFIFAWNEFLFAISLTSTDAARTVPAALAFFTGRSQFEQPTSSVAAAAVVVTLPVLLFVWMLERRIVSGLTAGAVKG